MLYSGLIYKVFKFFTFAMFWQGLMLNYMILMNKKDQCGKQSRKVWACRDGLLEITEWEVTKSVKFLH